MMGRISQARELTSFILRPVGQAQEYPSGLRRHRWEQPPLFLSQTSSTTGGPCRGRGREARVPLMQTGERRGKISDS